MYKTTNKYNINNVLYKRKILNYKFYEIKFDIHYNKQYILEFETFKDNIKDIIFYGKTERKTCNNFVNWICNIIDNNKIDFYIKNEFNIYINHEDVLLNTSLNNLIGYHISDIENRKSILKNGIIPNGNKDNDVMKASKSLDKYKPKKYPKWLNRINAVYLHNNLSNDLFQQYKLQYNNADLYAVKIKPKYCWIGSIGLSGFLLDNNNTKEHIKNNKLYWKNSCSLVDYLNNNYNKKIDKYWGLDEILVLHNIIDFELIGTWHNKFIFYDNIIKYIKQKFKNNYKQILKLYC